MPSVTDYEPRTYRGSDLDELLPKIREELGSDAIVLRQRDGLDGGIGGFFQKRCVEVVARRAAPRINRYDEGDPVIPEPQPEPAPEPPAPAIQEIMRVASPFVEQLEAAQAQVYVPEQPAGQEQASAAQESAPVRAEAGTFWPTADTQREPELEIEGRLTWPAPAPVSAEPPPAPAPVSAEPPPAPAPASAEPATAPSEELALRVASTAAPAALAGAAANHEQALVAAGIAPPLAAEILRATISHAAPFAPKRPLKHLVRDALAARIPTLATPAPGGRTIVFAGAGGSGKTICANRLVAAYAAGSDLDVTLLKLEAGRLYEPVPGAVTVVDTPPVSPTATADTRALERQLKRLGPCEVHVTVPATLSASAVRRLLDGLAALKPAAIVLTHLDEVDHAGPVIAEAIARDLALSYCSDADAIVPADPAALAACVLA
jgi:flagellar biosynthesis protein FlhF